MLRRSRPVRLAVVGLFLYLWRPAVLRLNSTPAVRRREPTDCGHGEDQDRFPMGNGHAPGIETGLGVSGAGGLAAGWADRASGTERRRRIAGFFLAAFFLADFLVGFFLAVALVLAPRRPALRAAAFRAGFFRADRAVVAPRGFFFRAVFAAFLALAMVSLLSRPVQCRAAWTWLTTSR